MTLNTTSIGSVINVIRKREWETLKLNKYMKEELLEAKRKLYHLLLNKNSDELSDNEVEIMFQLSKDEQIQELLNSKT